MELCEYGFKRPCRKCQHATLEYGTVVNCQIEERNKEFNEQGKQNFLNRLSETEYVCSPCDDSEEKNGELWCKKENKKCIDISKCDEK